MYRVIFSLLTAALLWSCGKDTSKPNVFADPVRVKIAQYQDKRQSDSLITFFQHENAVYREAAALAFASVQDTTVFYQLGKMLFDKNAAVRKAAAFALGQMGTETAHWALMDALVSEKDLSVSAEIIESLGKTGKGVTSAILINDTIKQKAFSWAAYRQALRGKADSTHVKQAITLLDEKISEQARIGAAHFFSRGPENINQAEAVLLQRLQSDPSAYVRMAVASALRKIKTPESLAALKEAFQHDTDYRVRANAVRSLQVFEADAFQVLAEAVTDANEHVAVAAAETLVQLDITGNETALLERARSSANWRIKGNLYEAVLANVESTQAIVDEIILLIKESGNPYEQAALLTALRKVPSAYGFVQEYLNATTPVLRSSSAASLAAMNRSKLFNPSLQKAFIDAIQSGMQTGDAAVIGTFAGALMNPALKYKEILSDIQFLYDAKAKLSLPRDNEALQPLEAAIAYFENRELDKPVTNNYNHPIDWEVVKSIPQNQQVRISTSKGDIVIQLFIEEAPGSVANFLNLTKAGYFDGKNFHRVVPNFVIQGGCNRGDGWGSEDYSIRSEFSMRRYKEGSVGMASAGKDTEGTQWFITHSPTPHLDGRYTIFAEVVSGMDVVHSIAVGDQIIKVEML
ncbi:MAG: peptidylprolyl isomerase [Cyclobacteriaceae bacterium]|nr:peptidylprolyl isomerase [Cyclobacteriaceae bacterium]